MSAFGEEYLDGGERRVCGAGQAIIVIVGWNEPGDPIVSMRYSDGTEGPCIPWSS